MYNYHILTSMNKTDIYEKLLDATIDATMNSINYEIVEEYIYHLRWLFEELEPEMKKYFFPEKEVKDVQLPEAESI